MDIIGVVHLLPLPSTPFGVTIEEVIQRAIQDAKTLENGGIKKAIVENFGDAPFYKDSVPPHIIAYMTKVIHHLRENCSLDLGVNVLRNDSISALAIAAATECSFIRVNVLSGAAWTDQGYIEGKAVETLLYRERLNKKIKIMADVKVKHAVPAGALDVVQLARELFYRAGADQIIITGQETGRSCNLGELRKLNSAFGETGKTPIYLGSGVTSQNVSLYTDLCHGAIVGTYFHKDAQISKPLDENRIRQFLAKVS